jgi:hypothetical protein
VQRFTLALIENRIPKFDNSGPNDGVNGAHGAQRCRLISIRRALECWRRREYRLGPGC